MEVGVETHRLRQEIERSLRRAFDPADVLPRLARLARLAPASSDDGVFAHRQLAELLVERHPWRAAIYARRALAHREDDDRAWAVLAFCQTLLGNFRCAAAAYKKAIASAPGNPWYAHNLGHLIDVALGAPVRALPWLRLAYGAKGDNSEIVASYVHALARAGRTEEARAILDRALERFESRELEALLRWLDQGAPSRGDTREGRPGSRELRTHVTRTKLDVRASASSVASGLASSASAPATGAAQGAARRARPGSDRRLAQVLVRGLSHLPFDSRQRERALVLARDVLADAARFEALDAMAVASKDALATKSGRKRQASKAVASKAVTSKAVAARAIATKAVAARAVARDVAGLAAAVAYAIVYVDHVPLSHAEVAAPFRVAVARLRGRFAELRAKLDIIPGDARYATTRGR